MSSGEPPVSVVPFVTIPRPCASESLETDVSYPPFSTATPGDVATGGSLDSHDIVTREVERKLELSLDDLIEMGKQFQSESIDVINSSKPRNGSSNRNRMRVPTQVRRGTTSYRPAPWPSRNYYPGELSSIRQQPYGVPPAPRSLPTYGGSPLPPNFGGGRLAGEPQGPYNVTMDPCGYSAVEAIGPPPLGEWYAPIPGRGYGPRRSPTIASDRIGPNPYPPAYATTGRYRQLPFPEETHQYAVLDPKKLAVEVGSPSLQSSSGYFQGPSEGGGLLTPDDLEEIRQAARKRAAPNGGKNFRSHTGKSRPSFDLVAAAEESALLDVEISYPVPSSQGVEATVTNNNEGEGSKPSTQGAQASPLSLIVTFKGTDVIKVDKNSGELTLDSGGWRTLSTKLVINNALKPLGIWIEEDSTPNSRNRGSPSTRSSTGETPQVASDVVMSAPLVAGRTPGKSTTGDSDSAGSGTVLSGGAVAVGSGSVTTRTQSPGKSGSSWVVADGRSFLQVFSDGMVIGRVGAATRMQMLARASVVAQHLKQMKSNAVTRRHRNSSSHVPARVLR